MRQKVSLLAIVALLALSIGAVTANAGNSFSAKRCQKGGWTTLYTTFNLGSNTLSGPFASEEACVSYAANGGYLFPTPLNSAAACQSFRGTFEPGQNGLWTCAFWDPSSVGLGAISALYIYEALDGSCVVDAAAAGVPPNPSGGPEAPYIFICGTHIG